MARSLAWAISVLVCVALRVTAADAGGLVCSSPHDPLCTGPNADLGAGGAVAPVALPAGDASAARAAYEAGLLHLWRDAANGTCLGALGAWHLTPRRIIAEGIEYEIVNFGGSATQIGVGARRVSDRKPTTFLFMPRSRDRVDVTGDVIGVPRHFNAALYRCRDRDDWWWERPRN